MKSAYYYLIASLPMLDFNLGLPISYQEFLTRCREQLSDSDMKIIEGASDDCVILKKWKEFDTSLRNELVRIRADRKKDDAFKYIRGEGEHNTFVAHSAHIIFNQSSPLEAEKQFDRIRWEKIEELKLNHFFDIDFLVCYSLELQILERWKKINQEEGIRILEEIVTI